MTDARQPPDPEDPRLWLLREHERLAELLGLLESPASIPRLGESLVELTRLVARDFSREEAPGGLYDSIRRLAPHHSGRVAELIAENRELKRDLDALCERARGIDAPDARLARDLRECAAQLRRHGRSETELMFDSMYTDIGGPD